MKFYEVMSQIVLTSHLVAFDVLAMNLKTWNAMTPDKQKTVPGSGRQGAGVERRRAPEEARPSSPTASRSWGSTIYAPDIPAFRTYAQKVYLASDEAKTWTPGILDKIAAIK